MAQINCGIQSQQHDSAGMADGCCHSCTGLPRHVHARQTAQVKFNAHTLGWLYRLPAAVHQLTLTCILSTTKKTGKGGLQCAARGGCRRWQQALLPGFTVRPRCNHCPGKIMGRGRVIAMAAPSPPGCAAAGSPSRCHEWETRPLQGQPACLRSADPAGMPRQLHGQQQACTPLQQHRPFHSHPPLL